MFDEQIQVESLLAHLYVSMTCVVGVRGGKDVRGSEEIGMRTICVIWMWSWSRCKVRGLHELV